MRPCGLGGCTKVAYHTGLCDAIVSGARERKRVLTVDVDDTKSAAGRQREKKAAARIDELTTPSKDGGKLRGRPLGNAHFPLPALRNADASRIDRAGFVEVEGLLSARICDEIARMPMTRARSISNALELDISIDSSSAARGVHAALASSSTLQAASLHLFGTAEFDISTLKILEAERNAPPQIPHSDDFWNRELFGVCHVLPGQRPTECVQYDANADWPTDLWTQCDDCQRYVAISDRVARKRTHCEGRFSCCTIGQTCAQTRALCTSAGAANDERELFTASRLRDAYSQLLLRPAETIAMMRPCGMPAPAVGDAVLGLPTLIHRGPGDRAAERSAPLGQRAHTLEEGAREYGEYGEQQRGDQQHCEQQQRPLRRVLFFTLRPRFTGPRASAEGVTYDPDTQIHAAWILWRTAEVVDEKTRAHVRSAYGRLGFDLAAFA